MSLLGTAALYLSCTDGLSSTLAMEVEGREGGRGCPLTFSSNWTDYSSPITVSPSGNHLPRMFECFEIHGELHSEEVTVFTPGSSWQRAYVLMGRAPEEVGDLYSKLKDDVAFRQEWAERVGLGFELVRLFLLVLMGSPAVSAHASDWPHFGRGKQ